MKQWFDIEYKTKTCKINHYAYLLKETDKSICFRTDKGVELEFLKNSEGKTWTKKDSKL